MMSENQAYGQLRNAIEDAVGRKMKTPKDFEFLSQTIFEKTHQSISPSTLKRFWGYIQQYASIRVSTLDLLAQFIDYRDYDAFCQTLTDTPVMSSATTEPQSVPADEPSAPADEPSAPADDPSAPADEPSAPVRNRLLLFAAVLLALLVVGAAVLWTGVLNRSAVVSSASGGHCLLKRGQIFETYSDYLRLFGITTSERFWDQPLPHHKGIIIWGPEFHHPQWHNDGERDSLMPTITEWWSPADTTATDVECCSFDSSATNSSDIAAIRNEHLYFTVMRTNELRITFMKNLTDTGYVFLGVYRTDLAQSDSTHVVWERVADECDLSNLDYLEQLRN